MDVRDTQNHCEALDLRKERQLLRAIDCGQPWALVRFSSWRVLLVIPVSERRPICTV